MDRELVRNLVGAGKPTESLKFSDGSEVLLLPYGGRILGLFADGDTHNFYWVNPLIHARGSACAYFASERWQNTGGERTWLGPEINFFFPHFPDSSGYRPPRPLDSGTFRVERAPGSLRLSTRFSVISYRHGVLVPLQLAKTVEPAANPLRGERDLPSLNGVQFAGYTLRTTLKLSGPTYPAVAVGLWSLTQLPQGGEMIIPTYGPSRPLIYFGKVGRGNLSVKPAAVHCRMRAGGNYKIGVRAVSNTGRVGYFYGSRGVAQLVVRNFFGNPSGDYVDAPRADPTDSGYGVQTCNVSDDELGNFSELEYHVPAIGGTTGKNFTEDVAQVWAFRGDRAQIGLVAKKLLGAFPFP